MAAQTAIPSRVHGPQSHFHSEEPSSASGPHAAHNLLREWAWNAQTSWNAERPSSTPPHTAACSGWKRFQPQHNRPREHHCRLKERPVAQAVASLANRLRSRMQNNQDEQEQQTGPTWPRVMRRRRPMNNVDREANDIHINTTDTQDDDEDWVILSQEEAEASRGAAPPPNAPQAPSLQIIRERCHPNNSVSSVDSTTMKSVGMGRPFKERISTSATTTATTASTAFDSDASFSGGWSSFENHTNNHHKMPFDLPRTTKHCCLFETTSSKFDHAKTTPSCNNKNRNRVCSEDSFDSQGRRRPRNCFVKVRKHVRRHVKKWAAARHGPCPHKHFHHHHHHHHVRTPKHHHHAHHHHHTNMQQQEPWHQEHVSFPIKHEMSDDMMKPVDFHRVPSWLTATSKEEEEEALGSKRPSHDWNDPSKDDDWYKSHVRAHLLRGHKKGKRKKKRKGMRKQMSGTTKFVSMEKQDKLCQDHVPQKRKLKRFVRRKKRAPQDAAAAAVPSNNNNNNHKMEEDDMVGAPPKKKFQPEKNLMEVLMTSTTTPGAFHADGYYDCMKGKVLSRITSTAPLLPPAQLFWTLAKAGLTLSDRAQRAATTAASCQTTNWCKQPQAQKASANCALQKGSSVDPASALCRRLIMGEVACSVLRHAMTNHNSPEYRELLLCLRQRLLMRLMTSASASASVLPHPSLQHSLREQQQPSDVESESMKRDATEEVSSSSPPNDELTLSEDASHDVRHESKEEDALDDVSDESKQDAVAATSHHLSSDDNETKPDASSHHHDDDNKQDSRKCLSLLPHEGDGCHHDESRALLASSSSAADDHVHQAAQMSGKSLAVNGHTLESHDAGRVNSSEEEQSSTTSCSSSSERSGQNQQGTTSKTIKVIVVGDSCSGKTSFSKGLVPGEKKKSSHLSSLSRHGKQQQPLKRKGSGTVGVDMHRWEMTTTTLHSDDGSGDDATARMHQDDTDVNIHVWDVKGDRAHYATQELVFSDHAVYVLLWDMAHENQNVSIPPDVAAGGGGAGSRTNGYRYRAGSGDSSSEEELESADYYLELEAASQRANVALEREINESVIFWYDRIAKKAGNSVVVPVATFSDKLDRQETYRRCAAMKQMLLTHSRKLKQQQKHQTRVPQIAFEDGGDAYGVLHVNTLGTESMEWMREKIVEVVKHVMQVEQEKEKSCHSSLDERWHQEIGTIVDKFRKEKHKMVPFSSFMDEWRRRSSSDKLLEEDMLLAVLRRLEKEGVILILDSKNETDEDDKLIVLNINWLLLAVSSITRSRVERSDLHSNNNTDNNNMPTNGLASVFRGAAHSNCPLITTNAIRNIWKENDMIRRAALRASKYKLFGNNTRKENGEELFYSMLQESLVRSNVLKPVDEAVKDQKGGGASNLFLVPSLLAPQSAENRRTLECWSYKCVESWKTILCNSWKITEGSVSSEFLMQQIIAGVLRQVHGKADGAVSRKEVTLGQLGTLRVHEVLCWSSACYLKLGSITSLGDMEDEFASESIVELFIHLVEEDSPMCVASELTGIGNRRLLVSAKGQEGDLGRRIWQGGFHMVNHAVQQVMNEFASVSAQQQQLVCPVCLACRDIGRAQVFDRAHVDNILRRRCDEKVTCFAGHVIDARLLSGHSGCLGRCTVSSDCGGGRRRDCSFHRQGSCASSSDDDMSSLSNSISSAAGGSVSLKETLGGVVLVGLWDGENDKIVRAGSGFVVDRKRGLIVTAAHTLMDVTNDSPSFGVDYYGMRDGKVVIGVIPQDDNSAAETNSSAGESLKTTAMFRYFAEIVAKDPNRMDACVLKITTRMEKDVAGNGDDCALQPEIPLFSKAMIKREKLMQLPVSQKKCELAERVKLVGFNQGGEGRFEPGTYLNRVACYAEGYVCKWFKFDTDGLTTTQSSVDRKRARRRLNPEQEIVLHCPTIGGHSGGPCVNQAGEVIGILSRADNADGSRCYLVPSSDFMPLVEKAKRPSDPLDEFL